MKAIQKKGLLITLVLLVVALTAWLVLRKNEEQSIAPETVTVKLADISKLVTATGTIEPVNEVAVGTQVSGEVEKIYVDYNTKVKKGDLIAELDKTNLKAALQQSQATYQNRQNEKNYYERIYNRQNSLFQEEVISKSDFEEAEFNYQNARLAVNQAASDLQQAKTNLGYADIYSPIDGVILSREVDEGQTVAANFEAPTLFTIAQDLEQMQVEANVDEADIGHVAEGQNVTFTVDAFPDMTFTGKVLQVRLDPTNEENVITYKVVIQAENKDLKLKPGMTATVSIKTLELHNVLSLEMKALNFQPSPEELKKLQSEYKPRVPAQKESSSETSTGKNMVWKYDQNTLVPTPIITGESDGINIQIIEGLAAGEKVVYRLNTSGESTPSAIQAEESPFMPKPPGRNNKKN
ncbi:efflux RND transporter periplasmic adaptor subunit [Christiangramia flava]|uniref:Macrolide-specific efflux protein MacA n=1 Tax=Christiangramia flava JLT2011 TaxID=1229726 RepID=A0A1L7I2H8_9FLAO|nr:efflux RND transporter periplasmic adaptor subunit [Christiangramia flava]APU67806.1 Macrolide-specific efflux protein MacA [Christiangramia flava JLT2011]OSS40309.1 Macrolide-specific efflux protein MacA [Christiangramia flava JLT2011]